MGLIKQKTFLFEMPTVLSTQDVVSYNIYYVKEGTVDYNSPKVTIPAVSGQTLYSLVLPDSVPVTDGQYQIGVASEDAAGNISDIAKLDYFFDFVSPTAPSILRVL